jgi:hypothetical protein
VVVAGCSLPPGVAVTVKTDKTTAIVEVFVGNDAAGDCDQNGGNCSIGPKSPMAGSRGRFFVGAGWTSRATAVDRAIVKGGVAHFQLQVDAGAGGDQFVPAVIVVGYDAAGVEASVAVLHDLDVPAGSSVEIRTTLAPAMPIIAPAGAGERVQVWRQPADTDASLAACVVVSHADGTNEFVTPAADTDCDGALPKTMSGATMAECSVADEWNYCGQTQARLDATTCVTPNPTTNSCRLAGPQCADAGPECITTVPLNICAPTTEIACLAPDVCTNLPVPTCNLWNGGCLDVPLQASATPRAVCSFIFQTGMATPCGGWPILTIDDNTADDVLNGRSCTGTAFVAVKQPFQISPTLQLTTADTITLVPNGDPCAPEVHVVGTANVDNSTLLDIVSGPSPQQHRMIPIHLSSQMTSACNSLVSTCSMSPPTGFTFTCP